MLSSLGSIAAAAATFAAVTAGQPVQLLATYSLPIRPDATYGSCSLGADQSFAALGVAWGGRNPMSGGYNHFCRGFALISLRTGAARTIVRLPEAQRKGMWTVDEPILVGNWFAYQRYIGATGSNWEIDILNLRTGAVHRLDHSHGSDIMDVGPVITRSENTLVWVSGVRDQHRQIVFQIHTFSVMSATGKIVATSAPGVRYMDAYISGSVICFLRQTSRGTDVWVENLRTGHFHQLTYSGTSTEAVITGPWVAWHVLGASALGPVWVADLRSGRRWSVTSDPSYDLSAGNGLLAWHALRKDRWTVLDLTTGRSWTPLPITKGQAHGTSAHVQGNVIVETAMGPGETALGHSSVQVYRERAIPVAPVF